MTLLLPINWHNTSYIVLFSIGCMTAQKKSLMIATTKMQDQGVKEGTIYEYFS